MSNKTMSGSLFWSFLERICSQGIAMIISIILAHLLTVDDFGIVSAVQIFTSIATVFTTGGISSALIHKKDADELDYSSMFFYNSLFSILVYFVVFALAPWFVRILNSSYEYDLLTLVLRVSGVGFVLSSFNSFYRTRFIRNLEFKKLFIITISGTIISAIVGIIVALSGGGVWALVVQSITSYAANSILLAVFSKWCPKIQFSFLRLKPMLGYGYKLMASSLLTTVYMDANSLVVGNRCNASTLAFYNRGVSFPKIIVSNIMSAVNSVLFPIMTKLETAEENVAMIKKFNQYSCFVIFPMMMGLAATAPSFVETVLGEKWLPAVPFLQLACLDFALQPLGISNLQYWKASGHATLYLVTDIIKKIIGLSALFVAVLLKKGVLGIAVAQVVSTFISVVVNLLPQKKLLNYSLLQQLRDIFPHALLSTVMFITVCVVGTFLPFRAPIVLIMQILIGVILYICLAKIFGFQELKALIKMINTKKVFK